MVSRWLCALTTGLVLSCSHALVCTNLTLSSSQDQRVVIQFQRTSQEVFILQTLPDMGALYEQVFAQGRGVVQGDKIGSTPFTVNSYNALYYRPYPKLFSAAGEPLSTFYYRSFLVPSSGPAELSEQCWVKIIVTASNNLPFSGGAGQCLKFDGADDHVYTPVQDFPESAITVSMWIKTLGTRRKGQVPLSFISFTGTEFEIRDLDNVRVVRGNNVTEGAGFSVNDGQWHQLGVTWDLSGNVQLFIDGRLVHKTSLPIGPPIAFSGDLILGQSGSVNYTSARQLWRASAFSTSTFSSYTSSYEQTLIVDRMEALEEIVTSSGEYRQRQPAFLQGIPKGCSCRGGAFDHSRSFEGLMDELRIYKTVRSEVEMQLDSHTMLSYPSILSVSNVSLWLYYTMDGDRWSSELPNDFNLIMAKGQLGGGSQAASPLRVPSDAPLVGAKVEDVAVPLGSWQLIDLKMMDFETNKSKLYARVETLPTLGNLWQSDDSQNPTTIIDRGDGRTKPLILSPQMQVWYEPVDLGQPNVMRWNDQGDLVKIDTRADYFMIRISDVQFIPEAMIDPDNPPPWITTQYVVRPMMLPIPVNQSISIQQGVISPIQLSWIDYERKNLDFLLLTRLDLPSYLVSWGTCSETPPCCSPNCAATNLCINCSDTCRKWELEESLRYSSSPNCSSGSVSTIPSRLATAVGDAGSTCASLPLSSDDFYTLPGPPVCSSPGLPLSDVFQDELFLAQVQSQAAFVPSNSNFSFKIERPGEPKSSSHFNVSSFSRDAFLSLQGTPINRAPFPAQLTLQQEDEQERLLSVSYSSSDPDGDSLFFRIATFPHGGKTFNPSRRNSSKIGGIVEETAAFERSIPLTQTYLLGPTAVPQGFSVIRRRDRDPSMTLEEQCGSAGVEGLEFILQQPTYVSEIELHALLPLSSPLRLFVRTEDVDWDVVRDVRHPIRTSVEYSTGASSPPARFDLSASHERTREMEETWSIVLNSSEWIQVWVGVAEQVKLLPEVFRILLPPLELPTKLLRLVTCGAWSLSAVGEVPSYLRDASQVFVSGFHGSVPQQLRGQRVFYLPEEEFQQGDGLSIIVSDGQLDAQSSSASSFVIPPRVQQVQLPDYELNVEEGRTVAVDLRGLAEQFNSSSLILLQTTKVGVLTDSAGAKLQDNSLLQDLQLFFSSSYSATAGPNMDRFLYRFADNQHERFYPGLVLFSVVCQPGRMILPGSSACRDCERGSYQTGRGMQAVCASCPPGTFQPSTKSTTCSPCPLGSFSPHLSSSSCSPCPPGTYSDTPGASRCKECELGRMMPLDRATSCFACGSIAFNRAEGRTSCSSCPVRTKTMSLTAVNASDCQCAVGSFNVEGCTGQRCFPCPLGMFCGGGRNPPLSRAGFWTDNKLWINGTEADVTECNYRALRDNCAGLERFEDSDLGYRTLPGLVTGEDCRLASSNYSHVLIDDSQCKEGYQGRFCTACADGAARSFDESCEKCTGEHPALFFFALVFVFTVFAQLVKVFIERRAEHFLVLEWGQCFNMLTYFTWPMPAVTKFFASSLSLLNFNFNFLPWACYGLQVSSVAQRCLLASLPPFLAGILFSSFELQRRWVLHKLQQGLELDSIWPPPWQGIMNSSAFREVNAAAYKQEVEQKETEGAGRGDKSEKEDAEKEATTESSERRGVNSHFLTWKNSLCEYHLRLGLVLYDMLLVVALTNSLQLVKCRKFADEQSDLEAIPDVLCWTPQHIGLLAVGSLTGMCHALLFPSFIMHSLGYSFLKAELQDPHFVMGFSEFYLIYESKYWWWYFTVLVRRIGFVFAAVFLTSYGYLQITVAFLITATSMFSATYFRPYKDNRYNILESFLHTVTALCVLMSAATSMQMTTARAVDHSQQGPVLLVVASLSSVAFIVISFSHNIRPFVLHRDFHLQYHRLKGLIVKRLHPRFIAAITIMVRWAAALQQRALASSLFKYHEFPFETGNDAFAQNATKKLLTSEDEEDNQKVKELDDTDASQPAQDELNLTMEEDLKQFKPIRSAWEADKLQATSFQQIREEEKLLLVDMLHHRGLHSLHPQAHLLERRVNGELKKQISSLNDTFHDLFAQAYDASGRVEVNVNYLNSLELKILNAEVEIRAELQRHEYMRRRLAIEDEMIPNEPILAMEQENLSMRAAAMAAEKLACQKEIDKLAKAVEEELEYSSSESD